MLWLILTLLTVIHCTTGYPHHSQKNQNQLSKRIKRQSDDDSIVFWDDDDDNNNAGNQVSASQQVSNQKFGPQSSNPFFNNPNIDFDAQRQNFGGNPNQNFGGIESNPFLNQNNNQDQNFGEPPPNQFGNPTTPANPAAGVPGMGTTQSACEDSCMTTFQYNPVCGDDNRTYFNINRLQCAQNCGKTVNIRFNGACPRFATRRPIQQSQF